MSGKEPDIRRQYVADVIESTSASEDPEQELLKHFIRRTEERDPELAKIIRLCAIPRHFDAGIIGVLREAREEREVNERWLAKLVRSSFVISWPDGGHAYDEDTREILLEDWRTAEKRDHFDELNRRLVTFYADQHEKAKSVEKDLERVADVVKQANINRRVQLAWMAEQRVVAPLLEALYHETLRSARDGYELFTSYYEPYEAEGRLTVCDSLLNATRDYFEHLPPDSGQEPWLRRMPYWEARLKHDLGKEEEAERLLRKLLPQAGGDTKLQLWVLNQYLATLYTQDKLLQAREVSERLVTLAEQTYEDPYNLSARYSGAADVHWALGELSDAADKYRKSIQVAQEQDNTLAGAYARLNLSEVLRISGKWNDALDAALEVLYLVRTKAVPGEQLLHLTLATQFMRLFCTRDQRVFDTIFRETQELLSSLGEPLRGLRFRYEYVGALQRSGQLRRAEKALEDLKADVLRFPDTTFRLALLMVEGFLREKQGHLSDARTLYTQILELSRQHLEISWHNAAALSNRGKLNETIARWPEAKSDLEEALVKWQRIGHKELAALMHIYLARTARRQGQLDRTETLLDEAWELLVGINSAYLVDYHQVRGEVYRDRGQWPEAGDQYQKALAFNHSLDNLDQAAYNLGDLATVAATQGQWDEADRYTAKASELWRQIATVDHYQPPAAVKQADEDNALGMRHFSEPGNDQRERIVQARDLFQSARIQVPENFWYLLNLAHAHAELNEWKEAAEAVEMALEHGPEWLNSHILYKSLADYRLRHGEALVEAGRYEAAAQWYVDSQEVIEGRVSLDRLASAYLMWGDTLLKLRRWNEAEEKYYAGLTQGATTENVSIQSTSHARLGCVAASRAELSGVLEHFRLSLQFGTQAGWPNTTWDLATICSPHINSIQQYRTLSEALRVLSHDPAFNGGHMQRFKPQVTTLLPEGWVASEMTTVADLNSQASVVAFSDTLNDSRLDTQRYAEEQGDLLAKQFPGYHEILFEPAKVFGERQGYIRSFQWTPEDDAPVTQVQLYYVEKGRAYAATATAPTAAYERLQLQLRLLLEGLELEV